MFNTCSGHDKQSYSLHLADDKCAVRSPKYAALPPDVNLLKNGIQICYDTAECAGADTALIHCACQETLHSILGYVR